MAKGVALTTQEAESLRGKEFAKDSHFNPVIDQDGNYFISEEEVDRCETTTKYNLVKFVKQKTKKTLKTKDSKDIIDPDAKQIKGK